jgi:hypothetical protein
MKKSLIVAPAVLAALLVAAPASAVPVAAVYTMTDAVVAQTLSVVGCSAMKTGGLATATFYADNTYTIVRTDVGPGKLPTQTGSWDFLPAKKSYTVYMNPSDSSLDSMFTSMDGYILANCQLKYPSATVTVIAPSVQASKNTMIVDNVDKSATMTYKMKGLQENTFKGATKYGKFSATITMKGNVVETPSFMM